MRMATGALIPLLMCACSSKIPPHLQPDRPSQDAADHAAIIDLSSALVHLTKKDPLVRAPALPNVEALEGFPEGEPLLAYVNRVRFLERGDGQVERELQQLEDEFQGTAVVALARGYRLRVVENVLATTPEVDEATEAQVAVLITPLQNATSEATLPRPPLAWLGAEGRLPDRVRQVADRWALSAWLDHPSIPLEPCLLYTSPSPRD